MSSLAKTVENDCEDQGFTRILDGCFNFKCQTWAPGTDRPTRPQLVEQRGFWVCPSCQGSYGAVKATA